MLTLLCPAELYFRLLNKVKLGPPACFKMARWHFCSLSERFVRQHMNRFLPPSLPLCIKEPKMFQMGTLN